MKLKALIFLAGTICSIMAYASESKPNILFIMSDDHTSQAIGAYGSRLQKLNPTPNLDQLVAEGMLMQNAFCTNAICTPSRACILTGQYSAVNGITTLNLSLANKDLHMVHEMKKAGYLTAVIGKWHLGRKAPTAFDYYKVFKGQGKYRDTVFDFVSGVDGPLKEKGHSSDLITDSVLSWLKNRDKTKPFFLNYHFKAPHGMFEPARRYADYLKDVAIPEPASLYDNKNNGSIATRGHNGELQHLIGSSIGSRHTSSNYVKKWKAPAGATEKEIKHHAYQGYMKEYLRCVKGVDENIKRVIDFLKEQGIYDNTLIIYTGDQGFYLGEHDYIDKRWAYDEGMRMPFIVRYPKSIKAGSRSDAIVENVDYGPTILDYAGIKTPSYMQGSSFKAILESGKEP